MSFTEAPEALSLSAQSWRHLFLNWSAEIPKKGIVVTTFEDQVPFEDFIANETMVFLQRRAPDSLGGRAVILPYDQITAFKFTEPVKPKGLAEMGFAQTARQARPV